MTSGRWSDTEIKCELLWRLARRHGWSSWIPVDELIKAVPSHEQGRARQLADDLEGEPYIIRHRNRGFKINVNGMGTLADDLHHECNYSKFRIEATLSHFRGFD